MPTEWHPPIQTDSCSCIRCSCILKCQLPIRQHMPDWGKLRSQPLQRKTSTDDRKEIFHSSRVAVSFLCCGQWPYSVKLCLKRCHMQGMNEAPLCCKIPSCYVTWQVDRLQLEVKKNLNRPVRNWWWQTNVFSQTQNLRYHFLIFL